ncbi:MAG TPA: hypothetical protein PKA95_08465 [Thermomicrobiales bacterium]|nr:hypothetical protein [Thermomicrobiales bacterium]
MADQFVRVREPHGLAGMTGSVEAVDGRRVTVRLTSWGTAHEFDVTELRQERRTDELPALRPAA